MIRRDETVKSCPSFWSSSCTFDHTRSFAQFGNFKENRTQVLFIFGTEFVPANLVLCASSFHLAGADQLNFCGGLEVGNNQ